MDSSNKYKSSSELKALAKEHMFGNYGTAIAATVVVFMIVSCVSFFSSLFINTKTISGLILNFLISFIISILTGLFTSGEKYFYLKISCGRQTVVSDVFYGFKLFPNKAILMQLYLSVCIYIAMLPMTIMSYMVLREPKNSLFMLLYSLSMIFYGVVTMMLTLLYSQAFFLLHDFPSYSARELLVMSRKLMKGSKGRLFYLIVSFLPLLTLGLLSCGLAYLWLIPYMNATTTEFFLDLIQKRGRGGNGE